ncbi:hypothetical protein QKW35_10175 [Pontibacterium granulatum]|uniref:hypothetical protein n=1 Tax=Pontibacterium granulatum TaxID=2036029 RepID=UPI00249B7A20|nr:hypothetical protein [Pontibacterium granulatum]MDI3324742.1 hypothetical protein [Pontibacterium granulatum]
MEVDLVRVNRPFIGMLKNMAGGMAAISTTILILAADEKLPTTGGSAFILALTALSVPLLITSIIIAYDLIGREEAPGKVHAYFSYAFCFGVAAGIVGYLFMLAKVSFLAPIAFVIGIAIGGYFYTKADKLINT